MSDEQPTQKLPVIGNGVPDYVMLVREDFDWLRAQALREAKEARKHERRIALIWLAVAILFGVAAVANTASLLL